MHHGDCKMCQPYQTNSRIFTPKAVFCATGSPVYVAPEVLKKHYGQKADVWSAGMVAYLLLCARLPWKTEDGEQSITFSDLYVSMGDGKSFNRKVSRLWSNCIIEQSFSNCSVTNIHLADRQPGLKQALSHA